jgi:hypothetical protein
MSSAFKMSSSAWSYMLHWVWPSTCLAQFDHSSHIEILKRSMQVVFSSYCRRESCSPSEKWFMAWHTSCTNIVMWVMHSPFPHGMHGWVRWVTRALAPPFLYATCARISKVWLIKPRCPRISPLGQEIMVYRRRHLRDQ